MATQKLVQKLHSSIIQGSQKVETTQMLINWWTGKQNVVCPYNGLFIWP